jgi:hypothetical protein
MRDGHSSGTRLAARLTRPTRAARRKTSVPCGTAAPIRSCSRWGLPCRPCCQGRGALLPHRFALARGTPCGSCAGGLFSVALSLGSPPPAVSRHRIPVEPGLSSTGSPGQARGQAAAVRPSGEARHVQKKARRQGSTRSHRVLPRPLRRKKPPVLRTDRIWFSKCVPLPCCVNSVWTLVFLIAAALAPERQALALTSRRMPNSRASVPASAWPVIASGRQWR